MELRGFQPPSGRPWGLAAPFAPLRTTRAGSSAGAGVAMPQPVRGVATDGPAAQVELWSALAPVHDGPFTCWWCNPTALQMRMQCSGSDSEADRCQVCAMSDQRPRWLTWSGRQQRVGGARPPLCSGGAAAATGRTRLCGGRGPAGGAAQRRQDAQHHVQLPADGDQLQRLQPSGGIRTLEACGTCAPPVGSRLQGRPWTAAPAISGRVAARRSNPLSRRDRYRRSRCALPRSTFETASRWRTVAPVGEIARASEACATKASARPATERKVSCTAASASIFCGALLCSACGGNYNSTGASPQKGPHRLIPEYLQLLRQHVHGVHRHERCSACKHTQSAIQHVIRKAQCQGRAIESHIGGHKGCRLC